MAKRIAVDEVTLAYEDSGGVGPVAVLVHGLGGSTESWRAQREALSAAGYRAIAYDQRGAGLSSKPRSRYSVELWADDLIGLLDALGVEDVALVGHSVGCMVAEHAALRLGGRCWAIATIGGALAWRPEAGPVFEERVRLARSGRMDEIADTVASTGLSERRRESDPVLLGLFRALIAGNDADAYAECSAATAVGRMLEPERLSCPALALCGELDPVTPLSFAEAIVGAVGVGEATAIEGAAHWCHLEAPEAVNRALLGFLDQHRPA